MQSLQVVRAAKTFPGALGLLERRDNRGGGGREGLCSISVHRQVIS